MRLTIPIAKAGQSIEFDTDRLVNDPAAFDAILAASPKLAYVLNYGATQSLNDAHASPKFKGADIIMAVVQKKLDSIYAGTIKTRGSGAVKEADPVKAECIRLTKAWWKTKDAAKELANTRAEYPALAKKTDQEIMVILFTAYMNDPLTVEKAKATVAVKAMKPDVKLNLSDFMPNDTDDEESDVLMITDQSDDDESENE